MPTEGPAYKRLDGPPNDVNLVRTALEFHGFRRDDMDIVQDAQATKTGILGALENLIHRASPGDIAVFFFAGHGHRLTDDDPEEEIDGYDEVLVPYGAPDYSTSSDKWEEYSGEYHIRDDTLGVLLDSLQAKVGAEGHVAVFLDACFSGTATRGAGELATRGGRRPIGPPARETRGVDAAGSGLVGSEDSIDYVVISAVSQQQKAQETYHTDETTKVGPLSHALAVALPACVQTTPTVTSMA